MVYCNPKRSGQMGRAEDHLFRAKAMILLTCRLRSAGGTREIADLFHQPHFVWSQKASSLWMSNAGSRSVRAADGPYPYGF